MLHLEVLNKTIYNKHIYDEIWQSDAWCLSICVQFEVMKCTWSVAVCVSCESVPYVVVFLFFFVFFMVWKIKMRSDESSWETWGPLETPKQWWGQRGTCFVFFPHIHHIFSIIHPTTQQLSAFPSSNSLKVSDAHNSTMPRCCPLALYPPQPRAIIHNLSVELGVKEVG